MILLVIKGMQAFWLVEDCIISCFSHVLKQLQKTLWKTSPCLISQNNLNTVTRLIIKFGNKSSKIRLAKTKCTHAIILLHVSLCLWAYILKMSRSPHACMLIAHHASSVTVFLTSHLMFCHCHGGRDKCNRRKVNSKEHKTNHTHTTKLEVTHLQIELDKPDWIR